MLVGNGQRCAGDPLDIEAGHLESGKGTPHPVAIEDGKAAHRRVGNGHHRVAAPDFRRDDCAGLPVQKSLERCHRPVLVFDREQLFDHDRRSAHGGSDENIVLVLELIHRNDGHGAIFRNGFAAQ